VATDRKRAAVGGADATIGRIRDLNDRILETARKGGEARGAVAREQDLPIARYESLKAAEIVKRLPKLSEVDLGKVDAYERKHGNRKTVLKKIESLRS